MEQKYLQKIPDWYKTTEKHDLVLSNDIDGLLTTAILRKIKRWKINYYYDFKNTYSIEKNSHPRVWCDVSILKNEKAFDNHVNRFSSTDIVNKSMINPNLLNNVSSMNYNEKYCGSTALMVWSIYNLSLPKSEEGKMLLLAIDTTFKGFYSGYKRQNAFYLKEMFGFNELYELEERHTKEDFYEIIDKYKLNKDLVMSKDGFLSTEMDLAKISELLGLEIALPDQPFEKKKSFKTTVQTIHKNVSKIENVVTLAFIYRNQVSYSSLV